MNAPSRSPFRWINMRRGFGQSGSRESGLAADWLLAARRGLRVVVGGITRLKRTCLYPGESGLPVIRSAA